MLFLSQSLLTGQTSPLCRFAIHSVRCSLLLIFNLPAAFSPAGRSLLTTDPHETHSTQKKIKNSSFFFLQQFVRFFFFFFPTFLTHFFLQNEQIFNRNCAKDSNSSSSKIRLVKGPTPVNDNAFSTLSISSPPIYSSYSIPLSSSQYTRSGHTHQRWCQYPPK